MLRSVYGKTLRDKRRAVIGWSIGLIALAAYTTALWPTVRDSAEDLSGLIDRLPEAVRALTNSTFDFTTPEGFLSSQPFGFMVPLLLLIFLIGWGARTIAGEEQGGQLELVLATPVPRRQIVAEKLGAILTGGLIVTLILWLAYAAGDAAVGMDVGAATLGALVANAGLLALVFGTLALAVGSLTGSRAMASVVATVAAAATYLLNAFANLVPALEPATYASPWRYYDPQGVLRTGLDPGDVLVLVALSVAFSVAALLSFERRDLAT